MREEADTIIWFLPVGILILAIIVICAQPRNPTASPIEQHLASDNPLHEEVQRLIKTHERERDVMQAAILIAARYSYQSAKAGVNEGAVLDFLRLSYHIPTNITCGYP